jgi:hypothetical protein
LSCNVSTVQACDAALLGNQFPDLSRQQGLIFNGQNVQKKMPGTQLHHFYTFSHPSIFQHSSWTFRPFKNNTTTLPENTTN